MRSTGAKCQVQALVFRKSANMSFYGLLFFRRSTRRLSWLRPRPKSALRSCTEMSTPARSRRRSEASHPSISTIIFRLISRLIFKVVDPLRYHSPEATKFLLELSDAEPIVIKSFATRGESVESVILPFSL